MNAEKARSVATVYGASELAVIRSFLEAYQVTVVAAPPHMMTNAPHWTTAIGGTPVLVPASQAQTAFELLADVAKEKQEEQKIPVRHRVRSVLLYMFFAVAPPSSGCVLHPASQ